MLRSAFNRSFCETVNVIWKLWLRLYWTKLKPQLLEYPSKKLQLDESWPHSGARCLRATSKTIELQERKTKWCFRHSNRNRTSRQWTHYGQQKTKISLFVLYRTSEMDWNYPKVLGHRNLSFQNNCHQSSKSSIISKNDARKYYQDWKQAMQTTNTLE